MSDKPITPNQPFLGTDVVCNIDGKTWRIKGGKRWLVESDEDLAQPWPPWMSEEDRKG